ncbi:MAG TPA: efflux transporter outer membrane subunit [Opitutaceae bacterium]|jgi:NodT family efflux transporter outer membrane factor (OMF) lipoprotein
MPGTKKVWWIGVGALALAACTVGPNYKQPKVDTPPAFVTTRGSGVSPLLSPNAKQDSTALEGPTPRPGGEVIETWWSQFQDPELTSLLTRALAQNRDLKIAIARVREARAERVVAGGALLPQLEATAGYNRSRGSKNVIIPLGGSAAPSGGASSSSSKGASSSNSPSALHPNVASGSSAGAGVADPGSPTSGTGSASSSGLPPGGPASPFGEGGLPGVTTNLYQTGFDAVYEFDLFGGTRRTLEAADAQAAAAVEGEHGVQLSLLAEVASSYLQLREAQSREKIARENLQAERAQWKIADDKFHNGLGNESQAAQQGAQVHLTEATLPPIAAQEQSARQALAFLLAEDPNALDSELAAPQTLPNLPPELPLGVPSDLLRRRPDVRQAERQLAAAYAEIGVATAQLFPQFSITGAFGFDSSKPGNLLNWASHYYSVAPGIQWPILNWRSLEAGISVQNAAEDEALLTYQSAVSQALKDVQDALVQYESERVRHVALESAALDARRAFDVAQQTESEGLADQIGTLDAERTRLQIEDSLAQSDASLRLDLISLYKALGGGWTTLTAN